MPPQFPYLRDLSVIIMVIIIMMKMMIVVGIGYLLNKSRAIKMISVLATSKRRKLAQLVTGIRSMLYRLSRKNKLTKT